MFNFRAPYSYKAPFSYAAPSGFTILIAMSFNVLWLPGGSLCYAGFIFIAIKCLTCHWPSLKNRGFELGKYKNASIITHAYMPHYIRHPQLIAGCLVSEVLRYMCISNSVIYWYSMQSSFNFFFMTIPDTVHAGTCNRVCVIKSWGSTWSHHKWPSSAW